MGGKDKLKNNLQKENVENNDIELSNSITKEEDVKDIDLNTDYNFIIQQNNVIFVNEITKKDVKTGGKISQGVNYANNDTVTILDKDYGKSAELMRILLETADEMPLWKKILMWSMILIFIVIIGAVGYSFIPKEEIKEKVDNSANAGFGILPDNISNNTVKKEVVEKKEVVQKKEVVEKIESVSISNQREISILRMEYDLETLKLENQRLKQDNIDLGDINEELHIIQYQKESEIEKLQDDLAFYRNTPKDLSNEAFLLHLGTLVYEGCEKAERSENVNKCKDLYFKYVKND